MSFTELQRYIRPLMQWWWLIVLAALLSGASAFGFTTLQEPMYRSVTTFMVGSAISDPNPSDMAFRTAQALARSYSTMAQRDSVRNGVMEALGLQWLPAYRVNVLPDGAMIEIVVVDTDPVRAQAVADEVVRQLILLSPERRDSQARDLFVRDQMEKLETSISDTENEIQRQRETLAGTLSARAIRGLEDQIATLEAKLTTLQANYASLLASTRQGALNTLNIVEPASLPTSPIPDRQKPLVLLAAALGALLAVAGALFMEYADDRVRSVEQITEQTKLATLGTVPQLTGADLKRGTLVMTSDTFGNTAEAFRVLRTNLQFASIDRKLGTVLITSALAGDGKTLVAANLATALAQAGRNVLLVDTDLRKPNVHRMLGVANNVGVTTALLGEYDSVTELLQPGPIPGLNIMAAGPLPPNPSELLGSRRMNALVSSLRSQFDIVILDSPPVTVVSDTIVLAGAVDGVMLVVRWGVTRVDRMRHAVAALEQVRAHVFGVVLNDVQGETHGYYYSYGGDYGYGYYGGKKRFKQSSRKPLVASTANPQGRVPQAQGIVPPAQGIVPPAQGIVPPAQAAAPAPQTAPESLAGEAKGESAA